jgi:hypothetical protein
MELARWSGFIICPLQTAQMHNYSAVTAAARCNALATAERPFQVGQQVSDRKGMMCVISLDELRTCSYRQRAFASQNKDHFSCDLINDTIHPGIETSGSYTEGRSWTGSTVQPVFIPVKTF